MGPIWQAQLGESLVMLIGPSWAPKFTALFPLTLGTNLGDHYGKKMFLYGRIYERALNTVLSNPHGVLEAWADFT